MNPIKQSSAVRRAYPLDYIERIPVLKTLDEMLAEISEAGWLVNNLFQWGRPPVWRCNLRFEWSEASEFCDGETKEEALAGAIMNMRQGRNVKLVLSEADRERKRIADFTADL